MDTCIVGISTIPGREKFLYKTLNSLLQQTVLPNKIILSYCKSYKRFPDKKINMSILNHFKTDRVILVETDDYGPITKLFGILRSGIPTNKKTCFLLIDDDLVYSKDMIQLFKQKYTQSSSAYSFMVYYNKPNKCLVGQGADGFLIPSQYLYLLENYYKMCIAKDERIFFHDDLLISKYLSLIGCPLKSLKHPSKKLIYDMLPSSNVDALHCLEGTTKREILNSIVLPNF